jgi:acid stress-induced BolA-like protein IbaG/YrbA
VIAVSDQFETMSRVKKQQFVYAPLAAKIAEGSMHAVSIKTFTESQWKREKMFNLPQ